MFSSNEQGREGLGTSRGGGRRCRGPRLRTSNHERGVLSQGIDAVLLLVFPQFSFFSANVKTDQPKRSGVRVAALQTRSLNQLFRLFWSLDSSRYRGPSSSSFELSCPRIRSSGKSRHAFLSSHLGPKLGLGTVSRC